MQSFEDHTAAAVEAIRRASELMDEIELRFGPGLVTDLCECGLDRGEHWDGVGGTGQGCGKFVAR